MQDLIERVRLHWLREKTLFGCLAEQDIRELTSSSEVQTACARLSREELGMAELSTNTARGKISLVASSSDWSISVVKDYVRQEDLILSPYPTILIPINEHSAFSAHLVQAAEACFHRSRISEAADVKRIGSTEVSYPGYWATPRAGTCANITSIAEGSLLAIVNGAPYAPYTHVLDSELQYKGSSFSSPVFNGRVFFSDLIKQFCVNGLFSACEDDELERLDQYIRTVAVQPESVAEEAWPLIQAMASADGEAAIELLTTIGAGDHELSERARSTLQAIRS